MSDGASRSAERPPSYVIATDGRSHVWIALARANRDHDRFRVVCDRHRVNPRKTLLTQPMNEAISLVASGEP